MSLEEEYERICRLRSDINEHCPLLRKLGATHAHITEFGVRYGVSTLAFLAGRPANLISYDTACLIDVPYLQDLAPDTNFVFKVGDTRIIDIAETEVLFIDTWHTADQLTQELNRHHQSVLAHIVMHDTETFGITGEDGTQPAMRYALSCFLNDHPEWTIQRHYPNNNGMTMISRPDIFFKD